MPDEIVFIGYDDERNIDYPYFYRIKLKGLESLVKISDNPKGNYIIRLLVTKDGKAFHPFLWDGPDNEISQAMVREMKTMSFEPARLDEEPVHFQVYFTLDVDDNGDILNISGDKVFLYDNPSGYSVEQLEAMKAEEEKLMKEKLAEQENQLPRSQNEEFIPVEKPPSCDMAELNNNIEYPKLARMAGIEGKVIIRVFIDKNGELNNPYILYSDHILLEESAIKALKSVPFQPALRDGKTLSCWLTIPIRFELSD